MYVISKALVSGSRRIFGLLYPEESEKTERIYGKQMAAFHRLVSVLVLVLKAIINI